MSYKKITLILFLGIFLSGEKKANAQSVSFSYTGSLQTWTVPCATVVTITATGAQGGGVSGGLGAKIVGTFSVTPGHVIDIVVGGAGANGDGTQNGSGGGGTFIWDTADTTLLLAAAGGGGYSSNGGSPAGAGSGTTTPTAGGGSGSGAGGTGGNGGGYGGNTGHGADGVGGGGAGWLSDGGTNPGNFSEGEGGGGFYPLSNVTPAAGGAAGQTGATGGYGGGGGSSGGSGASGGGGGYNGGGGGNAWSGSQWGSGGGGGSYNGGSNQTNTTGANTGNGSVTITWVNAVVPVTASGNVIANEVTCDGTTGEANAVVTGIALSYSWTGGETTDTATGLTAGTYTVNVTSACGGSASAMVTITQPVNVITASASVVTNDLCHGGSNGSASATASGVGTPYTYMWTPSNETSAIATGLTAGIYSVLVTNACGATASASVTITQPASLGISAMTTANVLCNGGNNGSASATASSGTPPYGYSWSPYGGITDSAVALTAGTYTIFLTDANGCTGSASTNITQPQVLTASASVVTNVLCNGGNTGSVNSTVGGGTGPYTYAWTGGQTNATASNLVIGTYTVDVTDANGCTASAATNITQPTALVVTQGETLDSGTCTGSAWVTASGGVYPYNYSWSNGSSSYYLHYVCHDTFCYRVTDAHGCVDSGCINVPTDLGVANISNNGANLKVYPNPNNGQFTIQSSVIGGQWSVEVYNMLGERVYSQLKINNSQVTINLGGQPAGIYLYRVISSDNGSLVGEGKIEITK